MCAKIAKNRAAKVAAQADAQIYYSVFCPLIQ